MAFLRELFHADIDVSRMRTEYRTIEVGDKADGGTTKKLEVQLTCSPHHVELTPADAGNNDRHVISFFVKEIAASQTIGEIPIKVVVVNEANRLSRLAQQALRRTMEKYARTCRLILVTDSLSQIIEPVRSRCLVIRMPKVSGDDVQAIVAGVAAKERVDISADNLAALVREAHGNIRRALILLEIYATRRRAGASGELALPEWERYADALCESVKRDKLDGSMMKKIRNHLYELLVHCIPPTEIFRRLTHGFIQDLDVSLIEPVTEAAAEYEARMQNGTRPIFHLEAFVARFVCIYRDFFASVAVEEF
jgi:replication factor C subunit 3/5